MYEAQAIIEGRTKDVDQKSKPSCVGSRMGTPRLSAVRTRRRYPISSRWTRRYCRSRETSCRGR